MKRLYFLSFAILLALIVFGSGYERSTAVEAAPGTLKGEWTAQFSSKWPDRVQLSFNMRSEKGHNMMGESFRLNELQGLTSDAAAAADAVVKFSIIRDAGTIECEGSFRSGRGAGFWTFTTNPGFVSAMKDRGYAGLSDEDLLRAAFHNLTIKYADEIRSAGYNNLTFEQLSRGAGHDVTPAYIRELNADGYASLTMDELIRARNHDIDGAYIAKVRSMGFDKQPLEMIIRLHNHEIDADFISQMKSAGFDNLTIENLIRLKNHEEGYNDVTADIAIRLKNHDVDADFIRRAKAQGYTNVSLDELIRLSNRGTIK